MSARATIRRRLAAERGVTLTEMLVVLVILLIVLAGMTTLFVSAGTSQVEQTNRVEAQRNARLALDALRRELRCASAVTSVSASTLTIKLPGYCQKPAASSPAEITWCAFGTSAPYALWRSVGTTCATTERRAAELLKSNAVFTYNRPTSPLAAPTLVGGTGGTLGPGTYMYTVTKIESGVETALTTASIEFDTGATNSVSIAWTMTAGASYRVYGRDDGSQTVEGMRLLKENATSPWVDTGAAFVSMATPPLGSVGITLQIDASTPSAAGRVFTLHDDVVLRNSGRG